MTKLTVTFLCVLFFLVSAGNAAEVETLSFENFKKYSHKRPAGQYAIISSKKMALVLKNIVINATFETSSGTVGLLTIRSGLVTDIIQGEFSNFAFKKILDPTVQDTLKAKIRDKINLYLPVDRDDMVKRVFLQIVTQ